MGLHLWLSPSGAPQKCRAQPAPPWPGTGWGTEGGMHPTGALRSIRHQGQGLEGGLSPPPTPAFWSLVFLLLPEA